jgi:hypothetical protein
MRLTAPAQQPLSTAAAAWAAEIVQGATDRDKRPLLGCATGVSG